MTKCTRTYGNKESIFGFTCANIGSGIRKYSFLDANNDSRLVAISIKNRLG